MTDISESWPFKYSSDTAFFPGHWQNKESKFWPAINRVDNAFGDRNLICTCPSMESIVKEKEINNHEFTSQR